jgi:ribosomal protein S18 acetylase RimI-like enzyme
MEIRELTPDEIIAAREIDGVEFPVESVILGAVDDNGKIVGRIALMSLLHIEGTWVDEAHRGGSLAVRLVKKAENLLAANGFTSAIAYVAETQPEIGDYLQRFGYSRLPLAVWQKPLGKEA